MHLQVWVQQVRVNIWKDKAGQARVDNLLVCMDNDESGENIATAFEYVLTPEEAASMQGQTVRGKSVTLAVSEIRPVGSTLKLRGRILRVEGKSVGEKKTA